MSEALVDAFIATTWGECNPYRYRDAMIAFVARTIEAERERAAMIAEMGCLVPPDGGSPTESERKMCDRIAAAIRALKEKGNG